MPNKRRPRRNRRRNRTVASPFSIATQGFPAAYNANKMKTQLVIINTGSGSSDNYKGNSLHLSGPQMNNTGTFAANVPAGLVYLFASYAAAGAGAPYQFATVRASKITVKCLSSNTNAIGGRIVVFPSAAIGTTGMGYSQAVEQPFAQHADLPVSTTGGPITVSNSMTTSRMYGVPAELVKLPAFGHYVGVDPTHNWYWHVNYTSADGTSNLLYRFEIIIEYDVVFTQRNPVSTATPV